MRMIFLLVAPWRSLDVLKTVAVGARWRYEHAHVAAFNVGMARRYVDHASAEAIINAVDALEDVGVVRIQELGTARTTTRSSPAFAPLFPSRICIGRLTDFPGRRGLPAPWRKRPR